ncbi:MAG: DUF885 domain-containing protein [Xanthomonadales bacterium]|nr:DUF885 domain-containing protein [Xanthomonadales bacterium]
MSGGARLAASAIAVALLCGCAASPPRAGAGTEAARALHRLFAEEWERGLAEDPVRASLRGDRRYDDRWGDLSLAAFEARAAADRAALARLRSIPRDALGERDRISHQLFEWMLEERLASHGFGAHLIPLNQRGGLQTLDTLADSLPFAEERDYRAWIARLERFGELVEQTVALMQEGMRRGIVPPRVVMQRIPAQLDALLVAEPRRSRFYRPFERMPAAIPPATAEELRAAGERAIAEVVLPALARFREFFVASYLPACRESIGLSALPRGREWYRWLARRYTTTGLSPEEIHRIGLAEVERIRGEMEAVRRRVGFAGSLAAFIEHLRSDPRFYHDSPEALFRDYLATSKRIDGELLKVFHAQSLPRTPYGLRPIPEHVAPDTTTAYYLPPSADGRRPGYYYVNLYRPETRPRYEMMALSIHEAVPGHHLQIARALELEDLPPFRRHLDLTVYVEGWALYSEKLGHEMGLYDDPYDHFGQLTYDMWRAVRLVVDTGIHALGWSREQAIEFFRANAAKSEADIVNEIDRYIAWPGQALAYKIGELEILRLRREAEAALGERFDLRDFHELLLAEGPLPLSLLEARVRDWIEAQRGADAAGGLARKGAGPG